MNDMSVWTGTGRVTRDGELKTLGSGTELLSFGVAINRSIPPKDGTEWQTATWFLSVEVWGRLAKARAPGVTKGRLVAISGELKVDSWEKEGKPGMKVVLVANAVQALGPSRAETTQEPARETRKPGATFTRPEDVRTRGVFAQPPLPSDDFTDDIPF